MATTFGFLAPLWRGLFQPTTWWWFSIGLAMGSFYNVCIYRIPRQLFWSAAFSFCPHCQARIQPQHNIPLLSFLWLRGRAACCGGPISWRYPVVELTAAVVTAALAWRYPAITAWQPLAIDLPMAWRFLHSLVLTGFFLLAATIDSEHRIIPDVLSLPMVAMTPVVVWLHPELDARSAIFGVALGGGVIVAIDWLYYAIRRETGIGLGDAKLLAVIGGWLGYQAVLPSLFFAAMVGSVYGLGVIIGTRRGSLQQEVPFGPFLVLGACVYFYDGPVVGGLLP